MDVVENLSSLAYVYPHLRGGLVRAIEQVRALESAVNRIDPEDEDLVEAVAKALYRAAGPEDEGPASYQQTAALTWINYADEARAAITAVRAHCLPEKTAEDGCAGPA